MHSEDLAQSCYATRQCSQNPVALHVHVGTVLECVRTFFFCPGSALKPPLPCTCVLALGYIPKTFDNHMRPTNPVTRLWCVTRWSSKNPFTPARACWHWAMSPKPLLHFMHPTNPETSLECVKTCSPVQEVLKKHFCPACVPFVLCTSMYRYNML